MGDSHESPTEGDGDQEQDVDTALADAAERPSDAAVNPAVAFTLLEDEAEGEEPSERERNDEGAPAAS
jgi:hypothetical protein